MRLKQKLALLLVVLLLMSVWPGVGWAMGKAFSLSTPVYIAEPNRQLGGIAIRNEGLGPTIPENSSATIALQKGKITDYGIAINNIFDTVNSVVYNDSTIAISWGNIKNIDGRMAINITADLSNVIPGEILATISSPSFDTTDITIARVIGNQETLNTRIWIELENLIASGKNSNAYINQSYVDLGNTSNGSVSSKTYSGINQDLAENTYSVQAQTYIEAHDRITRFVFKLTNQYRPETDLVLSGSRSWPTVHIYTYGTLKDQAIYAILSGLGQCLNSLPINGPNSGGDSSTWVQDYYPEKTATKVITTFKIGNPVYTVSGTTKTMDVAPYVKNDRTYLPVRYVANSLGIPDSEIKWDNPTQTVTMKKENKTIKLIIGNQVMLVDDKKIKMDVAPEIIPPGRTMLPLRFVAEALGSNVDWDEKSQEVIITQEVERGLR